MGDMKVELWRRLPPDIVERILSFLSVPVLCRFRTVCKSWNLLICNPEFGALCIQHARQDALFLAARYTRQDRVAVIQDEDDDEEQEEYGPFGANHGWSFLDLSARRWYTLNQDGQEVFDWFKCGTVAMDGGLLCQFLDAEDQDVSIFVSNPIAKTSRRLQVPPCYVTAGDFLSVKVEWLSTTMPITTRFS